MQITPQFQIEAPPELAAFRDRFASEDPRRFEAILELVGLQDAGGPIRVVLAPESSDLARQTPDWIAGFASGESGAIVVFPERSPVYPDSSLEDVLRHEVAHILVSRAAGGRPVPRWFNEGLAMAAEHGWRFEDQTRLLYEFVVGPRNSFSEVDRLFLAGQRNQQRAYALSGAFVRDLMRRYGDALPALILERVRRGASFDSAFADAVGRRLADAESEFWDRQRIWTTWVPIVTSSAVVWLLVTFIALLAIRRRRQKDAAIRKKWDDEDSEESKLPD